MTNAFRNAGPPLSAGELEQLESLVGPLHPSLRAIYQVHNGGRPERRFFDDDCGCENEIDSFLSALHRRSPHEVLLEEYFQRVVRERGAFPDTFVPFARNAGDDLYVMDRNTGKIFFWAHDVPDEPLRAVSDSLDALLAKAQTEADFYG